MKGFSKMNKDELIEYLKDNLTISVESGNWISPNERTIILSLDGQQICQASFDIADQDEYCDY